MQVRYGRRFVVIQKFLLKFRIDVIRNDMLSFDSNEVVQLGFIFFCGVIVDVKDLREMYIRVVFLLLFIVQGWQGFFFLDIFICVVEGLLCWGFVFQMRKLRFSDVFFLDLVERFCGSIINLLIRVGNIDFLLIFFGEFFL